MEDAILHLDNAQSYIDKAINELEKVDEDVFIDSLIKIRNHIDVAETILILEKAGWTTPKH